MSHNKKHRTTQSKPMARAENQAYKFQNRRKYDQEQYNFDLQQSIGPYLYVLNPINYERCSEVRPEQPGLIARQGVSHSTQRNIVDIESDLKGYTHGHSKDISNMYRPHCPNVKNTHSNGYPCGGGVLTGFENGQEQLHHYKASPEFTEYTRNIYPSYTLRETGINRFDMVLYSPQDEKRWYQQAPVGINYRMVVKDNHVPRIPVLIDQSPCLPKPQ
jgi:hypothetical protein